MGRPRTGLIRFALGRLAGFVATLVVAAFLLALFFGGGAPVSAFFGALAFDFGMSASLHAPVGALIAGRLAVTVPLAVAAAFLAVAAGFPLGFLARHADTPRSTGLLVAARVFMALPAFWLGMLLVVVFAGLLRWTASGGFMPWQQNVGGAVASLFLPAVALALPFAAIVARATARLAGGIDASPVIFAARLHGLSLGRAIFRHGFVPATVPLLGFLGARFGLLLAGAMVVENVFYLPGLGRLLFGAATGGDFALVRGTLFVLIALAALARFLSEIAERLADPRRLDEVPA